MYFADSKSLVFQKSVVLLSREASECRRFLICLFSGKFACSFKLSIYDCRSVSGESRTNLAGGQPVVYPFLSPIPKTGSRYN